MNELLINSIEERLEVVQYFVIHLEFGIKKKPENYRFRPSKGVI